MWHYPKPKAVTTIPTQEAGTTDGEINNLESSEQKKVLYPLQDQRTGNFRDE